MADKINNNGQNKPLSNSSPVSKRRQELKALAGRGLVKPKVKSLENRRQSEGDLKNQEGSRQKPTLKMHSGLSVAVSKSGDAGTGEDKHAKPTGKSYAGLTVAGPAPPSPPRRVLTSSDPHPPKTPESQASDTANPIPETPASQTRSQTPTHLTPGLALLQQRISKVFNPPRQPTASPSPTRGFTAINTPANNDTDIDEEEEGSAQANTHHEEEQATRAAETQADNRTTGLPRLYYRLPTTGNSSGNYFSPSRWSRERPSAREPESSGGGSSEDGSAAGSRREEMNQSPTRERTGAGETQQSPTHAPTGDVDNETEAVDDALVPYEPFEDEDFYDEQFGDDEMEVDDDDEE